MKRKLFYLISNTNLIKYRLLATIKRHPITIYEECSCMYVSNSEKVPKVRLFTTYYGYTLKKRKSGEYLFDKYGIKTGYEYIFEK